MEIVSLLLENGADVSAPGGPFSCTELQEAVLGGHEPIVKLLLEGGADITVSTSIMISQHSRAKRGNWSRQKNIIFPFTNLGSMLLLRRYMEFCTFISWMPNHTLPAVQYPACIYYSLVLNQVDPEFIKMGGRQNHLVAINEQYGGRNFEN